MPNLTDRIRHIRDALTTGLVERDLAIRLALLAALSGEHLLLVGPPGTAKSLVARRLHLAFADARYFERLLTRFSVPEELFGPLSIKGLEEDRYERLTDSYLPTASIAFLDEIFKANSAILNALLTLLNEREFDNGTKREPTPLTAVIGASNELPDRGDLDALFDRFLLRLHLAPVSKDGFPNLLRLRHHAPPDVPDDGKLKRGDLEGAQTSATNAEVPDDVLALLSDLREWCRTEDIFVSDRRWHKVVKLLKTSAWTNGRDAVSVWDCWLLQHCLWSDEASRTKICGWYAARVGAADVEPSRLFQVVNAWERRLDKDQSPIQKRNAKGDLLFVDGRSMPTTERRGRAYRNGDPLFVLKNATSGFYNDSKVDETNNGTGYTRDEIHRMGQLKIDGKPVDDDRLKRDEHWLMTDLEPMMAPPRFESVYITHVLNGLDGIRRQLSSYKDGISQQIASFETDIRSHLWVTEDFVGPASQGLEKARVDVEALLDRLAKLTEGFEGLPREEEDGSP